jgi:hypothetical protein
MATATLHNNRKVTAHIPGQDENMPDRERKEATSRSSHLEQAFQKMNQATFDVLTFQEFSKEFPADLVRNNSNETFLRDLHSQLVSSTSSAIQVGFSQMLLLADI